MRRGREANSTRIVVVCGSEQSIDEALLVPLLGRRIVANVRGI